MNEKQVLTNGALNYYQTPQTVLVRDELIRNYITNLQKQNTELKDNWNKLKEWLEEEIQDSLNTWGEVYPRDTYKKVLEQIQEIEGGMNE